MRLGSFKIISAVSLPAASNQLEASHLHLFHSSNHDPIVSFTYPKLNQIKLFNIIHLQPRKPPPFPFNESSMVKGEHLDDFGEKAISSQKMLPTEALGWELPTADGVAKEELIACAMGNDGTTVVGVGSNEGKGALWIWKL
ncbi:hypothetical protein H0H92_003125 [Tricholoma furcatifolium]|nr:hypothetical protein H0H92_003125 [Tricholoma furcatifolium]